MMSIFCPDTPSQPASPDYTGIARTQARASNPNITNPLGSQTVTWNGDIPSIVQSLTPEQQALLSQQQARQLQAGTTLSNYATGLQNLSPIVSGFNLDAMSKAPDTIETTGQRTSFGDAGQIQRAIENSGPIQRQLDYSGLTPLAGPQDFAQQGLQAQQAILARQEPLLQRQADLQHTQLANQGIPIGSEAYIADENQLARNRTDAEQQAILAGNTLQQQLYGMGLQSRQQTQAEANARGAFANQAQAQQYGQNLGQGQFSNQAQQQAFAQEAERLRLENEARQAAFMQSLAAGQYAQQGNRDYLSYASGQAQLANQANQQQFNQAAGINGQVQMPQFQGFQPPNYLNAAQAQGQAANNIYNAQVGSQNAQTQGLYSLGSNAALAAAMYFSDRRLKSKINKIGIHPIGVGIYEYDIFGQRQRGVMADEVLIVMPEAISMHPSGYMMVDYGRL